MDLSAKGYCLFAFTIVSYLLALFVMPVVLVILGSISAICGAYYLGKADSVCSI